MRQEALATKPIFNRINGQKRHKKNGIKMTTYSHITVCMTLLAVVTAQFWKNPHNITHKTENSKVQTPQLKAQISSFGSFITLIDNPSVNIKKKSLNSHNNPPVDKFCSNKI